MNHLPNKNDELEEALIKRDKQNMLYIKLIVFGIGGGFLMGVILFILVMITSV